MLAVRFPLLDAVFLFVLDPVHLEVDEVFEGLAQDEGVGGELVADGRRRGDAVVVAGPNFGLGGELEDLVVEAVVFLARAGAEIGTADLPDEQKIAADEFVFAQDADVVVAVAGCVDESHLEVAECQGVAIVDGDIDAERHGLVGDDFGVEARFCLGHAPGVVAVAVGDDDIIDLQRVALDEVEVALGVGRWVEDRGRAALAVGHEIGEVAVSAGVYLVEYHGGIIRPGRVVGKEEFRQRMERWAAEELNRQRWAVENEELNLLGRGASIAAGVVLMQNDLFDSEFNAILAAGSYAEFAERLRGYDCRRCDLCHYRTNIVIDRGDPNVSVMLIGERPGDNEDLRGQPFIGRAGELLDKMFRAIDIEPNRDLIIANVTKCRPEYDQAPLRDQVDACMPFLEKQIALVEPRVIVLLGAVALKWIDPMRGDFKMEEEAGKFFTLPDYPGVQFMVMYNPAFLLRDPRKKPAAWEHLKALRDYLQSDETAAG